MTKASTTKSSVLKTVGGASIIASIYVGVRYFHVDTSMMYGLWMAVGKMSHLLDSSQNQPTFLMQLLQLSSLFAPALIVGFIMAIFKQPHSFKIAFAGTLIAYSISAIISAFQFRIWGDAFIIPFVAMFTGYSIASLIVRWIYRPSLVWILVIALALIDLLALPSITKAISMPIIEKKRSDELSLAITNMDFTAYYPTYIPKDLKATGAKLEGYHNSNYQHQHVSYSVGKLEFMISEKLKNQDPVFNKRDNCDISTIWFEMRAKAEISQSSAERSRDNLSVCRMLGKTDSGHEVYIEANKGQFQFYYMEIDGTIIVMQHDTLPKPRYAVDFEKEVLKVFNSMQAIESSKLIARY